MNVEVFRLTLIIAILIQLVGTFFHIIVLIYLVAKTSKLENSVECSVVENPC